MNVSAVPRSTWYFVLISGAIFSFAYGIHSDMSGLINKPSALGTFSGFWPYSPRFLTAWIAYSLFGSAVDTLSFRIAATFCLWIPTSFLLLAYARRINALSRCSHVLSAFVLIMLAHYCLPNVAAQYYIYDMPAILFYLIAFMLLTSSSRLYVILGGLLTLVFTLNREPIAIALFHSAAWWLVRVQPFPSLSFRSFHSYLERILGPLAETPVRFPLTVIAVSFVGTLILRQILMLIFTGRLINADEVMLHEGENLRLVANAARIVSSAGFFQQFLATGFGLVLVMPLIFNKLSIETKALAVVSLVPLIPLVFVGNFFTELRIYNEYVPLMTCVLSSFLLTLDGAEDQICGSMRQADK